MIRDQVLFILVGASAVALGLPLMLRTVPPNRWYGVRIRATLADPKVWYGTNAVAGRDLAVLGMVLLATATLLSGILTSEVAYALACTAVLVVGSVIMTVRAVRLAHRLRRERGERHHAS
jgi:uncharacterized membrane protein